MACSSPLHCFSCTILRLSSRIVSVARSLCAMASSSSRGNRSKHLTVHWGPDPTRTDRLFLFFQANPGKAAAVFGREKEGDRPSTGSGRNSKSIYAEVADYVFRNDKDEEMRMHYLSTRDSDSAHWAGVIQRRIKEYVVSSSSSNANGLMSSQPQSKVFPDVAAHWHYYRGWCPTARPCTRQPKPQR